MRSSDRAAAHGGRILFSVATAPSSRVSKLLYRGFAYPQTLRRLQSRGTGDGSVSIGNRRYSRLETCATFKGRLKQIHGVSPWFKC